MTTKENIAIGRRVDALEREISSLQPTRIITVLEVYGRGPEPRCETFADVREWGGRPPAPELLERIEDLDVLIDAETGAHVLRHEAANVPAYLEAAKAAREIRVVIPCHEVQVPLIRSCLPLTEMRGGARAGKTRSLVWWLFRQWLLRGHGVDDEHDEHAKFWWIREGEDPLWEYGIVPVTQLWPPVFVGAMPTEKGRGRKLSLFDGSVIEFRHAGNKGAQAGRNLRSANVEAAVVDEKSAIHARENWREILNRVAQTHGPIATATTPTQGHWSEEDAEEDSGGLIYVAEVDRFQNPWLTISGMLGDMVKEKLVSAQVLVEKVLAAPDQVQAAKLAITDPDARRSWLGESSPMGHRMFRGWRPAFIVQDAKGVRDELEVEGYPEPLPCITAEVLGRYFRSRPGRTPPDKSWLGQDFNVAPCVGVVLQVFGIHHRPSTWHALVVDEVANDGSTGDYCRVLSPRYPGIAGFCDPTGAMPNRHASHGPKSSTDAAEMRAAGHWIRPANGTQDGKTRHLPQLDSLNVMHKLLRDGRLLVHARCAGVIDAMRNTLAKPDGTIAKTSGTNSKSDKRSAYADGVRYGLWRPFSGELTPQKTTYGK